MPDDSAEQPAAATNGTPPAGTEIPRATPAPRAAAPLRAAAPAASPRRPAPPVARRAGSPPPPRRAPRSGRSPMIPIVSGVAALGLAVFAATQIFGGDEEARAPNTTAVPAPTAEAGRERTARSLARGETQVSVFNGTTIGGLAAATADKLRAAGFPAPLTGNNPDQQRAATLVLFASREARRSAQEVARLLRVSEPEPMDDRAREQAGPEADVVVIVGSDQTQ